MDIFLDLDGTLTDAKPGITGAMRHALEVLGCPVPGPDDLDWCIGPPLFESFETLTGDPVLAAEAVALYRMRYTDTGLFENRVYDGVPEMLGALRAAGHRLWLATSKPHAYARRITAHFGIDPYLDGLFGAELDGTRADKTALLAHALAETGADPVRAAMLGDRKHDMIGAAANGLARLGALWGYGGRDELSAAGAEALAAAPGEVAGLIETLRAP